MRHGEAWLVRQTRGYLERRGYLVALERDLGYGRADLVGFRVDARRCLARQENGQLRSLNALDHYRALRHLPEAADGVGLPLKDLGERIGRSPSHLRSSLIPFLLRSGYVRQLEDGTYAKVNGFIPIASEIIAVEAKVSDWRWGAMQAKRHRWFANRVVLALSADFLHRVDRELLKKHGIGLIAVDSSGVRQVMLSPALPPRDPDRHSFAGEWLWRFRRKNLLEVNQG